MNQTDIFDIRTEALKYTSYLLLQGPKGFFFYKLGNFLKSIGKKVYKINFNGGDLITYPSLKDSYNYRGKIEKFESYLRDFISSKEIDVVLLCGDYKTYHRIAVKLCKEINLPVYVFEEGYIRPHYITLEKGGINGWSSLPKNPAFYMNLPDIKVPEPKQTKSSYLKKTFSRILHYSFLELLRWYFPHYVPTKSYFPYFPTIFCWIRGILRKFIYKYTEKKVFNLLVNELRGNYFLVPLQVYNDSQITIHSKCDKIEDFITEVMESFAKNSKKEHFLVFKHHPEDRGCKNYKKHIKNLAEKLEMKNRVFYVHDLHLPTLIKGSLGVIVINSTAGLQSLYHNIPVKVLGKALYDIPGLTFQGNLDRFWKNPGKVNKELYKKFRAYIIKACQLNGSFYGRFPFEEKILSSINLNALFIDSSKDRI